MRTFKFFGILIAILLISTAGHYFLPKDLHKERRELTNKIISRDYASAEKILEQYKWSIPKQTQALYSGYIGRGRGDLDVSDRSFGLAQRFARESGDMNTLKEARLNILLNAYLDQRKLKLENLEDKEDYEKWQNLLSGLAAYEERDYAAANSCFKKSSGREFLSSLMRSDFEKFLCLNDLSLSQVRAEIEIGDFLEARRTLQPLYQSASEDEKRELRFLMGLTYFKEAEAKNSKEALPFFKIAFEEFRLSSILSEKYLRERKEIAKRIVRNIDEIFRHDTFSAFDFYFNLLTELREKEAVEKIKVKLLTQVDSSFSSENRVRGQNLLALLNKVIRDKNARGWISDRFWGQFEASLEREDLFSANGQFRAAKMFCNPPCLEIEFHGEQVVRRMIASASHNPLQKRKVDEYLKLLLEMQTNRKNWLVVENLLISSLHEMWKNKKERNLALSLFTIIKKSPFATKSSNFQTSLERVFSIERETALNQGNLEDLEDLNSVQATLELALLDQNQTAEIKNWISEAQELYRKKKYREAKEKASLVLKVEPENIEAKKILGLIAYLKGEYTLSYKYLEAIPQKDVSVVRKMAVLEMLKGNEKAGNLLFEKLQEKGIFTPDIYLEIAFAALSERKPEIAMKWIQKADPSLPEVAAARCFAAFEMNSWKETISLFDGLPKKFQRLDGFQGIAIESYFSLGNVAEGKKMLEALLKMPPSQISGDFPQYVQLFIENRLNDWNRYYIAATYYKVIKKDPDKALDYFNKIENPSFIAQMEKGELYLQVGDPNDAREIFQKVLIEIKGEDQEKSIKKRLLPLLGTCYVKLGYFYDAIPYYREYAALGNPEDQYLVSYANVLMEVKRYDLALQQFEEIKSRSVLSNQNMVDLIECLVRTDQFEQADKQARDWLSRDVPLIFQIKALRFLIITKNKAIEDAIFSAIAAKEVRTAEENEQLILLRMELGDYNHALNLADTLRRGLESTPQGLMTLAKLSYKLSNEQEALEFAESALNYDQGNLKIRSFIDKLEHNLVNLARKIRNTKEKLDSEPHNVTLQLEYSQNLINLSIEMVASGEFLEIKQSQDFQTARSILDNLVRDQKEFPKLYFLLGEASYLQDLEAKALSFYEAAIKQDPSYVEALQYIALIYEGKNELQKAIQNVEQAAKFDPSNAEIWLQLANLYTKEEAIPNAIEALKNAIKFAPNASDPYIKIAENYLRIKNPELSIENLNKALQLSPKNILALQLMILTLYDQSFAQTVKDSSDLEKIRLRYLDKLQSLDPDAAKELRERLSIKED